MFHYNYEFKIVIIMVFALCLIFLLFFFLNATTFYSADKGLKKNKLKPDEVNILCKLKYSKPLFFFFYWSKEGISKEVYWPAIRNYVYCLLVVLSIVAYAVFLTKTTFIISAILVLGELVFIPVDTLILKIIRKRAKKNTISE